MTANVYKEVLSVLGAGVVAFAVAMHNQHNTSQVISVRLTVDGVVAERVGEALTHGTSGVAALGGMPTVNSAAGMVPFPIPFATSLKLELRTSVNRTSGSSLRWACAYYLTD